MQQVGGLEIAVADRIGRETIENDVMKLEKNLLNLERELSGMVSASTNDFQEKTKDAARGELNGEG